MGIPGQQQSPSHCVHSASNNHGFLFAFSLCVCLQAHKHVLYLCALCMFAGHDIVCGQISSLSVSRELSPVSLSVKAGSRGKNVETLQKPCFIYVPIGSWIKSVVKVLVAETSV